MKRAALGEFEEVVLLWVTIQNEEAYGQSIAKAIEDEMARKVTLSSVHTALYRLEEKGLVESRMGEASAIRGGRRKRVFTITNAGKEALWSAKQMRAKLWSLVPNNLFE